ncbi:MAG: TraB/GumN family protein [Erythrobacter sp.]
MSGRFATALLAFAALLALPACGEREEMGSAPPNPLLYEIANAQGEVEGWMLGTIHALPDGVDWRTEDIDRVIGDADLLLVEVAKMESQAEIAMIFGELATTEGLGPLSQRVSPDLREPLGAIVARSQFPAHTFANTESWAAAIMLARVDAYGKPGNGVDSAVIRDFAGREVRGFETARGQLGVFDRLAKEDQRELVEGTVREWQAAQDDPGKLTRAWLAGDLAAIERATSEGIMADPELREALLAGRNRAWMPMLIETLEGDEKPLVAVGAAHLVGPEGLAAMLQARGYGITRVPR